MARRLLMSGIRFSAYVLLMAGAGYGQTCPVYTLTGLHWLWSGVQVLDNTHTSAFGSIVSGAMSPWNNISPIQFAAYSSQQDVLVSEGALPTGILSETAVFPFGSGSPCDNVMDACDQCYNGTAIYFTTTTLDTSQIYGVANFWNISLTLAGQVVLNHEFGHVLGLNHSDDFDCGTTTIMAETTDSALRCQVYGPGYSGP